MMEASFFLPKLCEKTSCITIQFHRPGANDKHQCRCPAIYFSSEHCEVKKSRNKCIDCCHLHVNKIISVIHTRHQEPLMESICFEIRLNYQNNSIQTTQCSMITGNQLDRANGAIDIKRVPCFYVTQ